MAEEWLAECSVVLADRDHSLDCLELARGHRIHAFHIHGPYSQTENETRIEAGSAGQASSRLQTARVLFFEFSSGL